MFKNVLSVEYTTAKGMNVQKCLFFLSNFIHSKNNLFQKYETYLSITCAVYNYLGTEILASYGDENIYLFDTQNTTPGDYLHSYSGHKCVFSIEIKLENYLISFLVFFFFSFTEIVKQLKASTSSDQIRSL